MLRSRRWRGRRSLSCSWGSFTAAGQRPILVRYHPCWKVLEAHKWIKAKNWDVGGYSTCLNVRKFEFQALSSLRLSSLTIHMSEKSVPVIRLRNVSVILSLLLKLVWGWAKTITPLAPKEEQSRGSTQVGGGAPWFWFLFLQHFTHFMLAVTEKRPKKSPQSRIWNSHLFPPN